MSFTGNIGNWIQNTGAKYNLPELGISELFGVGQASDNTAAQQKQLIDSGQAHWEYQSDGSQVLVQGPTPTQQTPTSVDTSADTNPYRTTTTGGTSTTPNFAVIGGKQYNLNNAGELAQYIQDKSAYFDGVFNTFKDNATQAKELDILQANADEQRTLAQIKQALDTLATNESEYGKTYAKNLTDLFDGYVAGAANRQNYYAQISPLVQQSAQASGQQFADTKYNDATTEAAHQKELAANQFAQARTGYAQQQQDVGNSTNLYRLQRENQFNQDLASKAQEIQGYKDANNTDAMNAGVSTTASSNAFKGLNNFALNQYANPTQADLSAYTPYIGFNPVANQGSSLSTGKVTVPTTPKAGVQSVDQYLGYDKNQLQ